VTELLLHYGADPNHRCEDWSTPVHAGVFSCNTSVVSGLLDAGGDLRLHDGEGRTPFDWLRVVKQEGNARVSSPLSGCWWSVIFYIVATVDVCVNKPCQELALPASIPLIRKSDLTQLLMNLLLCVCVCMCVCVCSLHSKLFHPQLLQLMAVSPSDDLQWTGLVFECVTVGTLHNLLHNRRAEFPVLQDRWLLSVMLQVCEGLQYLHGGGLVMRALSSHSVVLTKFRVAKLTCLGFMVPSESACVQTPKSIVLPSSLYRWAAPEVIKQRPCTKEADVYSLCALIQELYTDSEPWGTVNPDRIKQVMDAGEALAADSSVPQPYYDVVLKGLKQHPQDRTCSLQSLCSILQHDIKVCLSLYAVTIWKHFNDKEHSECVLKNLFIACASAHNSSQFHYKIPLSAETAVERQTHLDRQLDRQSYSGAKPKLERERDECTEVESMLQQVGPYTEMCSLLEEFYSGSAEEESETEADIDREIVELSKITVDQQLSTILVNLKVSQELLQQANWSLDTVERVLLLDHRTEDQLDSLTGFRDAPPSSSMSSFSISSTNTSGVNTAAAPPSKHYSLFLQREDHWVQNLEAQLLSRDWELLSHKDLALWQSHYPAEQQHYEQDWSLQLSSRSYMTESHSERADHSTNKLSQYRSALNDSLVNVFSGNKLQVSYKKAVKVFYGRHLLIIGSRQSV
uniref:Protein kinase domain-containing protein n=1 Tax=Seriola lalandi dorsalis TaxID=1841481 RepID=A0A3B4YEM0_SERLL